MVQVIILIHGGLVYWWIYASISLIDSNVAASQLKVLKHF